jgi:predicted  nucleic acid-binding Zn-ribbon protein
VADKPEVDPKKLFCATPGCKFEAERGDVLKACTKCGKKRFVNNVQKEEIEAAAAAVSNEVPAA